MPLPNYTLESAQEDIVSMLEGLGRIASRPRWRAPPRATLRCLGLSALIACAGGVS